METIFDKSRPGRGTDYITCSGSFKDEWIPENMRTAPPLLPEADELTITRHYTSLSDLNFSVDSNFYPLGSCTMKYNPKLNEKAAALSGFQSIHPLCGNNHSQGMLELMYELAHMLGEISGSFALSPASKASIDS